MSDAPAPSGPRIARANHPSTGEYVRIALVLAFVTALEVAVAYIEALSGVLIPLLFGLALIKFVMVVMWFMHLKFDSRTYSRFFVMGIAGAVTLYVVVLLISGAFTRGAAA